MKVMVIMKGDPTPDQMPPPPEIFKAMQEFNMQLAEAGVLIDANGLQPSYEGKRVTLAADGPIVVDGPFAETKELLSGYWTLNVADFEEAIEWMRKSPLNGFGMEVELRRVGGLDTFGDAYPDELLPSMRRMQELVTGNLREVQQSDMAARTGA